jgi:hypothetical protein
MLKLVIDSDKESLKSIERICMSNEFEGFDFYRLETDKSNAFLYEINTDTLPIFLISSVIILKSLLRFFEVVFKEISSVKKEKKITINHNGSLFEINSFNDKEFERLTKWLEAVIAKENKKTKKNESKD